MTKPQTKRLLDETMALYRALPPYSTVSRNGISITKQIFPVGEAITVVSDRTAILTGTGALRVHFDVPIQRFNLKYKDGVWMTTDLQELAQLVPHLRLLRKFPRILVGGLGLGVVSNFLAERVADVVTVEIDPDIAILVAPFISPRAQVVVADVFAYLKTLPRGRFDAAYFDIWRSTGEWTWQTMVVPLRRLTAGRVRKILCWQENEMQGQVNRVLFRYADMPAEELGPNFSTQHYWTWRKGIEAHHPAARLSVKDANLDRMIEVEEENQRDPYLRMMAHLYLNRVGTRQWEAVFGRWWDTSLEEAARRKKKQEEEEEEQR